MRSLSVLKAGEGAKLYTYCYIREDAFDIYGFATQRELNSFKMLLGISGVGPKAALAILSSNSPEDLALAVIEGNEKALTMAQGIGKKLAQRIILELKDKVSKEIDSLGSGYSSAGERPVRRGRRPRMWLRRLRSSATARAKSGRRLKRQK
jgi:Holliday junction DNA helicase RuvA